MRGGVVQGIGTALYEEIPYDEQCQLLVGMLADDLVPGAGGPGPPHIRLSIQAN